MEIRKIKPEENVLASLVDTIVFLEEKEDYKEQLENPADHSEGYENTWAGFNDAGKICSVLSVYGYEIRFDGHTVGMGGIAGVGTLPEARNSGYIRRIFEKALPAMKEEGKVVSFLYPSSFEFYRKFGYELCYAPNRVTIPMDSFRGYPFPRGITQYFPGDDIAGFVDVYDRFIRDKNFAVVRDAEAMKERLDKDPYTEKHYAYLHRDADSRADSYIFFHAEDEDDDERIFNVIEMAWTSVSGLRAIFGFIGGLAPEFGNLKWDAPRSINIAALFPNCYDIEANLPAYGMCRVVDVPRALELMKAPEQPGRAVIRVTDKIIQSNDGVYSIEWENGAVSSVKRTDNNKESDLTVDIETFTQLVTGFLSIDEAKYKPAAICRHELSVRALFPHKNMYIAEWF